MNETTFIYSIIRNPTFKVWVGSTSAAANLYWEGDNFLVALWKLFEAKGRRKCLVRLEWA